MSCQPAIPTSSPGTMGAEDFLRKITLVISEGFESEPLIGLPPWGAGLITTGPEGFLCIHEPGPWVFLPKSHHGFSMAFLKDEDTSF